MAFGSGFGMPCLAFELSQSMSASFTPTETALKYFDNVKGITVMSANVKNDTAFSICAMIPHFKDSLARSTKHLQSNGERKRFSANMPA